jgi:hypothetical protein
MIRHLIKRFKQQDPQVIYLGTHQALLLCKRRR